VADLIALLREWQRSPQPEEAEVEAPQPAGDSEAGQIVYTEECALCHGEEAEGTDFAPALGQSEAMQTMTDEELRDIISFGLLNTVMRGYADSLTVGQIDDLMAFLRSIQ
jgi:mono/diheme cytochrome c family protein